jgi:threonine/homoserine/homoserine lactone efflux protein
MLPPDVIVGFFAACLVLALAPGPDNIFVLSQSALYGAAAGLFVTLGLCTGLVVHTTAVAFGIAALIQASDVLFSGLKFAGAAYLVYLAWQSMRATPTERAAESGRGAAAGWKLYRRGIVMNITNPKVSVFFLAFLPQFVNPENGAVLPQIFALGGLFIVSTLLVFGSIALTAGTLSDRFLSSPRSQVILNRIAGMIFILLAIKLLTARR